MRAYKTVEKFNVLTISHFSNRDRNLMKHQYLSFNELPKPGTLVAIDAEFVLMQQVCSLPSIVVRSDQFMHPLST